MELQFCHFHMEHLTFTNRIRMPRLATCFDVQTENLYTNLLSLSSQLGCSKKFGVSLLVQQTTISKICMLIL